MWYSAVIIKRDKWYSAVIKGIWQPSDSFCFHMYLEEKNLIVNGRVGMGRGCVRVGECLTKHLLHMFSEKCSYFGLHLYDGPELALIAFSYVIA